MDFSVVLAHLQSLYPGQLVLYVDDIAKILGSSDRAIDHLIARDRLPFKVKKVGGQRCVDIFQIAQWLADDSVLEEGPGTDSSEKEKPKVQAKARAGSKRKPSEMTVSSAVPSLTGNLAAELLKMRHQSASLMGRFVHQLKNNDEFLFMHEVLEKLFYAADHLLDAYCVTVKRLPPMGAKSSAEELKKYFQTEQDAGDYLVAKLVDWRFGKSPSRRKMVQHFQLRHADKTLFHAIAVEGNLTFVENNMRLGLAGF